MQKLETIFEDEGEFRFALSLLGRIYHHQAPDEVNKLLKSTEVKTDKLEDGPYPLDSRSVVRRLKENGYLVSPHECGMEIKDLVFVPPIARQFFQKKLCGSKTK